MTKTYIDVEKAEKRFQEMYCASCNSHDGVRCRACELRDGADAILETATTMVITLDD